MSGATALREMGAVMREMGVELKAFYTSNVEFYLWRGSTFDEWEANLAAMKNSSRRFTSLPSVGLPKCRNYSIGRQNCKAKINTIVMFYTRTFCGRY